MKTINVKLPIKLAERMSKEQTLNSKYASDFLYSTRHCTFPDKPIEGLTFTYSFKIYDSLHLELKIAAAQKGVALNEYTGRLFAEYYPYY